MRFGRDMHFQEKQDWKGLNQKGLIPGPQEAKESFLHRVKLLNHFFSFPLTEIDHFLTDTDWVKARSRTESLFDFSPDWMVGYYSNRNLSFFQGGATWIEEKEGVRIPYIQLKKRFEKGSFLFYRREEVLSHEAVHAARMQFDEPLFEEIFAYKTSFHSWRRFLGPLFQKPWECFLWIVLLFFPLILEIGQFFFPINRWIEGLSYLPLFFFLILFLRLLFLRITLALALHKLKPFLQTPLKKWSVALRLKDKEIFCFAYRSPSFLAAWIDKQRELRWQVLKDIYFKKT